MITLFTDASFDHQFPEAAAFAAWAKAGSGTETFRYARHFKAPNHPRTSADAELMAIMVGVILVRQKWQHETHVHVCSDNTNALDQIRSRSFPRKKHLKSVIDHFTGFLIKNPCRITVKHVKAHVIKRNSLGEPIQEHAPRSHVNDWCDREAYRLMAERRALLREQVLISAGMNERER